MKIYDLNLTGGAAAAGAGRTQETQKSGQASGGKGVTAAGTDDRVEFSSTLGRLSKAISAYGNSRSSRIEALAAQYQNGAYRPDSAATAKGMVAEAVAAAGR